MSYDDYLQREIEYPVVMSGKNYFYEIDRFGRFVLQEDFEKEEDLIKRLKMLVNPKKMTRIVGRIEGLEFRVSKSTDSFSIQYLDDGEKRRDHEKYIFTWEELEIERLESIFPHEEEEISETHIAYNLKGL